MSRTVTAMTSIVRNGQRAGLGHPAHRPGFAQPYNRGGDAGPATRLTAGAGTARLPLRRAGASRPPATRRTERTWTSRRNASSSPRSPGPKSTEWFARRAAAVPSGVANIHPIVTARASGAIIEDVDGNRLIDFATGIAVLNVGHTAPEVVAAAQRQLELDTHTCFHVTANEPYIELAERLNALAPIEGPGQDDVRELRRRGRRERGEDRPQGHRPHARSSRSTTRSTAGP